MTSQPKPSPSNKPKSEDGQNRSAQALRANLLKRKAQAKQRAGEQTTAASPAKGSDPT